MMTNFMNFALNMLKNNPRIPQDPTSQQILSAIQNQDLEAAKKVANEICQQRGISVADAQRMTEQSMNSFGGFN